MITLRARLLRFIVMSLVSVGVTLFAVEIVVRAIPLYPDTFYQYDPIYGWTHIPNMQGTYVYMTCLGEYRQPVRINANGLRDIERDYQRTDDEYRVLVIGDSVVAGFEVPLETTFFRQAQAQLNESTRVDVIGGGFQGYGTAQSLVFYEREGRRYDPDLVILMMQPANDITDNHHGLRYNGSTFYPYVTLDTAGQLVFHEGDPSQPHPERAQLNVVHDVLYENSRLYRLIFDRYDVLSSLSQTNARFSSQTDVNESLEITAATIQRLRASVETDGAHFGVILTPLNRTLPGADTTAWAWLETLLTDEQIAYRSPQALFDERQLDTPLFYNCDKYHWTVDGHTVMAGVFANFVRDLQTVAGN